MKTKLYYAAMQMFAAILLMTACDKDDQPSIGQTQLAAPVVTVNVDINAQTITASWQAVEHADNYHYKISGDETLYKTGETRLELQPYSKFEGGSHSITVQAVSTAQPGLFSPSEWGKADFSVGSTDDQTQLATPVVTVNVDRNAQTIIVSWQAVEHADNYHYKISGDETLYETGETRLELQPYSKFEGGSHSITVQAVSTAQPDLFSPSEWGKADFSVESTNENYASLFDPVFARVLQEREYIPDAEYISGDDMKHIAAITELDVSGTPNNYGPLTSMRGIEYFESLNILYCHCNQLTELDVSKNTKLEAMACKYNQLTSLNVNPELERLECSVNLLTELDLSKNTELTILGCGYNPLTELDLSNNPKLEGLACGYSPLAKLNLSNNPGLIELQIPNNKLTELDLRKSPNLTMLGCLNNQLTKLDLSNSSKLTIVYCQDNQLTELDVSQLTELEQLICNENPLTELDLSNNPKLQLLRCTFTELTELDLSNNPELTELSCGYTYLVKLNVSNNPKLKKLSCSWSKLTELDIRNNPELKTLSCSWCKLTGLDISKNTMLLELDCEHNPGDGESTFPIMTSTGERPSHIRLNGWVYNQKSIDVEWIKAE